MKKRPYLLAGKVGNLVWQRNRYGQICYERFVPTNPRTARQMQVRGYWGAVSAHWRTLQQWQRDLWEAAGRKQRSRRRMGRSGPLTGFNYFVKVNMLRANRGEGLLEVPPAPARRSSGALAAPPVGANAPERQYDGSATVALRQHYGILSVFRLCFERNAKAEWGSTGPPEAALAAN